MSQPDSQFSLDTTLVTPPKQRNYKLFTWDCQNMSCSNGFLEVYGYEELDINGQNKKHLTFAKCSNEKNETNPCTQKYMFSKFSSGKCLACPKVLNKVIFILIFLI